MPCLLKPDMHHTWLCIMPCLCLCVYNVVCFFPVLLPSSGNVMIVRIRSTTPIRLLHGLVLLPCGISAKMTFTLDITSILACQLLHSIACHALVAFSFAPGSQSSYRNRYVAMASFSDSLPWHPFRFRHDDKCLISYHVNIFINTA